MLEAQNVKVVHVRFYERDRSSDTGSICVGDTVRHIFKKRPFTEMSASFIFIAAP